MKKPLLPSVHSIFFYACLVVFISNYSLTAQEVTYDVSLSRQATLMEWTDVDSALSHWHKEYESEQAISNKKYKGDICLILSKTYNAKRDVEAIDLWNDRASEIYEEIGDIRGQAEVLYQKGFASFCRREYEVALDHVIQGIAIMEEFGDDEGIGLGYLRMSRLFHFTWKMSESADYGRKGGERLERAGDSINAVDAWSFAGHGFRLSEDSTSAFNAFKRSLSLAEKLEIPSVSSMAYNDLAAFHMEYDMYEEAETYFIKSLGLVNADNERQIMVIKNGLSQVYLHTGRYEECINISKEAMVTVAKTNDIFFLSELPEYIARSYEGLMQYDSAYKYMKLNWQYSDSLFTSNQNEALEEMKTKYETKEKERIISRQRSERALGLALLIGLAGVALLLYRMNRSKKKINSLLEESNKEKDFLIKEIHHRVKNNLQILSSLLSLQSQAEENVEVLGALQEGRNRVESMGMIHQRLYSHDSVTAINMREYVPDLCAFLMDMAESNQRDVSITSDVQIGLVDVETAIPLGLIINELITNSLKYAFRENQTGSIQVELWINDAERLCLRVSDNGNGFDQNGGDGKPGNFGTQLVTILSKKLKGNINVSSDEGYLTLIIFERYKIVN